LDGSSLLTIGHAIPAAMSTPGALDALHQPYLRDHEFSDALEEGMVGPLHLVACNRSVTENQAIRQLGFADAVVVSAPFGVYVADNIQKIQMGFIANCRDDTSTRIGVQRLLEWLQQSGEDQQLIKRAAARARIVAAIAREV
jgi:hypothetical protein